MVTTNNQITHARSKHIGNVKKRDLASHESSQINNRTQPSYVYAQERTQRVSYGGQLPPLNFLIPLYFQA
jgi:hypothetical protein